MSTSPHTFDASDADVILRTPLQPGSDEFKDFRVHKAILSIASTLFHDMFSIPQPPQSTTGDISLPVIDIVESVETFETFLRLIYPIEPPAINSLQLVNDLFRLAEKYMASGVHAKLKQILVSPSFLRDDPIWVYAIACCANLDEEAKLAVQYTFKIDLIRDISHTRLQIMTAEAYNSLLKSHAARRAELISALNQGQPPVLKSGKCGCGIGFYSILQRDIALKIWESPFLDRQRLDLCLSNVAYTPKSKCGRKSVCRVSTQAISNYFTSILNEIGNSGRYQNTETGGHIPLGGKFS